MTADELRIEMHEEFRGVRADVAGLRAEMATEFKDVRADVARLRAEMSAEFMNVRAERKADGETTRRYFDVMVEQVKDIVKVVAEGTVRNTERLEDHES